jgi:hypothetical protein
MLPIPERTMTTGTGTITNTDIVHTLHFLFIMSFYCILSILGNGLILQSFPPCDRALVTTKARPENKCSVLISILLYLRPFSTSIKDFPI